MRPHNTTRRAILAGIATAPALAAPTIAATADIEISRQPRPDARLRELWAQYLEAFEIKVAAHDDFGLAHDAYKLEEVRAEDGTALYGGHDHPLNRPIWDKYDASRLYDVWMVEHDRLSGLITAIQAEKAEGLFGVAVKLVAQDYDDCGHEDSAEHEDAIRSALVDIDRMIGTDFRSLFDEHGHRLRFVTAAEYDEAVS